MVGGGDAVTAKKCQLMHTLHMVYAKNYTIQAGYGATPVTTEVVYRVVQSIFCDTLGVDIIYMYGCQAYTLCLRVERPTTQAKPSRW